MSTAGAAVHLASPTRARRKALLSEYQKLKRENDRGTAPWRKEWKYVHYAPGETRGGKPFKEGGVFFRHANCRHEYKTSNPSQTARDHDCATARGYCAPPSPTDTPNERKVGTKPVTGGVKRKAVNLEGHFVPVSLQQRYKRLLARAVFENCSGVALSFVETPAMKAFTQAIGIGTISRRWVSTTALNDEYAEKKRQQEKMLHDEQFGQICSDAWTKKGVNDSHKMFNICVNMPSGKSTFVKSVPTDGSETITAEFIKKVLVESAEEIYPDENGEVSDRLLGFIGDGESANWKALRDLEARYYFLVNMLCQAHCISLLLKDLVSAWPRFDMAVKAAHTIVKGIHAHADIRQRLKRHMESAEAEEGQRKSTMIPGFPCETRFGSNLIMCREVVGCFTALSHTVVEDFILGKYGTNEAVQEMRDLVLDQSVIADMKTTVDALGPICNAIYTIEADRPLLSQVRDLWKCMSNHLTSKQAELRIPRAECDLLRVFTQRYEKSYHSVFPTAFLLDPAFAVDAGGPVLPPWGSLRDRDKSAVKDVITRLAGPGKQKAAMDELVCFTGEGFVDKTFALSAMERVPGKNGDLTLKSSMLRRSVWTGSMAKKFPILTRIAGRLMSMHATSCASERNWSVWRFTCRDNRRVLALDKAEKLVFISALAALEHGSKESLEELDIAALYEAALEESQETGADDIMEMEAEDTGVGASYAEQIAEELF